MSRNVVAVRLPEIGALFIAGIWGAWANDAGPRLKRDATIIPIAIDAMAIRTAENSLDLGVDIIFSNELSHPLTLRYPNPWSYRQHRRTTGISLAAANRAAIIPVGNGVSLAFLTQ